MRKPATVSEKAVEKAVRDLFESAGCVVYKMSQPRATMQTPGIADLYVLHPVCREAFWFEVKREGGKQRPAQKEFHRLCDNCGTRYYWGGVEMAYLVLERMGLWTGTLMFRRPARPA